MAELATIATIAAVASTAISATGAIVSGRHKQAAANFEAAQLDMQANEERAAAQRQAFQQGKETELLLSRGQTVAASSGLGALDPTVQELSGDIAQEGAYREGLIRYGGENRARGLQMQATASRASGRAAMIGSLFEAGGTIASGFSSFYEKYAKMPPGGATGEPLNLLPAGGGNAYRWG